MTLGVRIKRRGISGVYCIKTDDKKAESELDNRNNPPKLKQIITYFLVVLLESILGYKSTMHLIKKTHKVETSMHV